mmetsp:Transcript_7466/g.14375  ORF Transcript_7466/g.14375 Transcript_7466/m.14375 type:complete len:229 (+) Transcript_7466:1425-2111(+)
MTTRKPRPSPHHLRMKRGIQKTLARPPPAPSWPGSARTSAGARWVSSRASSCTPSISTGLSAASCTVALRRSCSPTPSPARATTSCCRRCATATCSASSCTTCAPRGRGSSSRRHLSSHPQRWSRRLRPPRRRRRPTRRNRAPMQLSSGRSATCTAAPRTRPSAVAASSMGLTIPCWSTTMLMSFREYGLSCATMRISRTTSCWAITWNKSARPFGRTLTRSARLLQR